MTDQTVRDHVNGVAYGGRIVSTLPVPEGWLVRTEVRATKPGEGETSEGEEWHLMVAWGHVDTMDRNGVPVSRLEPLFLEGSGTVVHTSEFRWLRSAGDVDDDGWRTSVAVRVVPPREMRRNLDVLNRHFCTKHTDQERTASDCEKCEEERRRAAGIERLADEVRNSDGDISVLTRAANSLGHKVHHGHIGRDAAYDILIAAAEVGSFPADKADLVIRKTMNTQIEDMFDIPER